MLYYSVGPTAGAAVDYKPDHVSKGHPRGFRPAIIGRERTRSKNRFSGAALVPLRPMIPAEETLVKHHVPGWIPRVDYGRLHREASCLQFPEMRKFQLRVFPPALRVFAAGANWPRPPFFPSLVLLCTLAPPPFLGD